MRDSLLISLHSRNRIPALLVAGALLFSACGGSSDNIASSDTNSPKSTTATKKSRSATSSGDDANDTKNLASGKPELMVALDGAAPSGTNMVTAQCELTDEELAAEEEADAPSEYHSDVTYAVPEGWRSTGRGAGSSGGTTGTDVTLTFTLPSKDKVKVEYDWDSRGGKGELRDFNGDVWKSFDYDSKIGDDATRIKYDKVASVSNEDQDIDLFYRDPSQAPNHVKGEQYKARVEMFTLPTRADYGGGFDTYSLVLTIEFDSDIDDVTQKVVETIVATTGMPSCVWDEILISEETMRDMDLDGDGKIKTREEIVAEMQANLDELQAQMEEEAKNN